MKEKILKLFIVTMLISCFILGCGKKDVETLSSSEESSTIIESEELIQEVVVETLEPEVETTEEEMKTIEKKYSSYQLIENDWPKGTVEEYVYTEDNQYARYVVKINDPEANNRGIKLNYVCDLPRAGEDSLKITLLAEYLQMYGTSVGGEGYAYFIKNVNIEEGDFEKFKGYGKEEFRNYFTHFINYDYDENGYGKVDVEENNVRALIEGSVQGGKIFVGCLIDKEQNQMLLFQFFNTYMDQEKLDRFVNSLKIVDTEYAEEY